VLTELKRSSAETRADHSLICTGDFGVTFLLIGPFAGADSASEGLGSEAQDDASSFASPQRQLALDSALVLASRLRALVAPLGAETALAPLSAPRDDPLASPRRADLCLRIWIAKHAVMVCSQPCCEGD